MRVGHGCAARALVLVASPPVDFAREVRPLLVKRCLACHDAEHAKGGLRLDSHKAAPIATRELYGLDQPLTADFGAKCLVARRLIEKGVRFVQLYSGGGHLEDTWDGHSDCIKNHTLHAGETDKPIAALIADLKRTGLWDETLLMWGGEFGRTPTSEGVGKPGCDHNWHGFSMWLAGGGVRGGQAIGATDELGFEAVEERHHVSDLHATILHLMGLDHERLTYFYQGLEQRITGVRGEVIKKALA